MHLSKPFLLIYALLSTFLIFSCMNPTNVEHSDNQKKLNEKDFIMTLQKHLDAVTNKDLATLKSTMSPEGKMQLILPGTEILNSVDSFMDYHREWFQDPYWTFETKILNTEIGEKIGIAITEIIYREPDRNGLPYFNRMVVSYGLEKIDGKWYIIKDHASSIEKSTDT